MTLQHSVARSVSVTLAATVTNAVVAAFILAILARLLRPGEVGVAAAALVIVKPVQQVLFNCIEQSAVLQTTLERRALASLFWLSTGAALLAIVMLVLLAWLLDVAGELRGAIAGLAFILLGSALGLAPRVHLRREMAFGRLGCSEIGATVAFGAIGIESARSGFGALSLVFAYVAHSLARGAISLMFCPGSVRGGGIHLSAIRPILSLGARIGRLSALEIIDAKIAPGLIGIYLGVALLGQFNQATLLMSFPVQLIAMSMTRVLSTSFRVVREDVEQLRQSCKTLVQTGSAATLPICFGIGAASHELIQVVLGPQWTGAAEIVPWLAVGTACTVLAHLLATMNEAVGRLEEKFLVQLVASSVLGVTLLFAVHAGLTECAWACAMAALILFIGQLKLALRVLQIDAISVIKWVVPGCLCGTLVYACLSAAHALFTSLPAYGQLGLDVACGTVIFVAFYALLFPAILRELLALARSPQSAMIGEHVVAAV
jgi:lipopolysaccharide exporter